MGKIWTEMWNVIIEAMPDLLPVGFGVILTLLITNFSTMIAKSKTLSINCKFTHTKGKEHHPFGYDLIQSADKQILYMPLWVEMVNDCNISKVCRNLSVFSYKNGSKVEELTQIQYEDDRENTYFYGNEGKYSFVIESNSIGSYDLLYAIKNFNMDIDSFVMQYIAENNKIIKYKLIDLDDDWKNQLVINYSNKWFILKRDKRL